MLCCAAAQQPDLCSTLARISSLCSLLHPSPSFYRRRFEKRLCNTWKLPSYRTPSFETWVHLIPGDGVPFHQVLAGSSVVLESPKPREKSQELKERLAKLQENAEKQAYSELVKDVVEHEEERQYFSSYKNSLGFGIHVLFIMFTGYMFGFALVRSQFPDSPAMHAAGGVCGLIVGMFVETILFITRVSTTEERSEMEEKMNLKAEQ